jgi:lipoprotein-anchoring transpeptidase ErfK/SrfK
MVETWPAPDPPAAQSRRASLIPPEKDPRYQVPRASSRELTIFLDSQTFEYVEDGRVFASGEVSTGSAQHPTPTGSFRVLSKDKNKSSGSYTNYYDQPTPMPYSLQFYGPYFIHEGWMPGHPDSHGCIRLHYEDARLLFERVSVGDPVLVKKTGVARGTNPLSHLFPLF